MSKKDLYLLCPEIAPEQRRSYSKTPQTFVDACKAAVDDNDEKARAWLDEYVLFVFPVCVCVWKGGVQGWYFGTSGRVIV